MDSKAVWADFRHFPGRENTRAFGQRVSTMDLLIACCFKGETSTNRHVQILRCPCIVIFRIYFRGMLKEKEIYTVGKVENAF